MFRTFANAFADKDLRKKIFLTLLVLLIYRIGCFVPVPGLDMSVISQLFNNQNKNQFLEILSSISGGALSNGTIFSLGIVPYINATIITQLLTLIIPALERWSHEGDEGRKKMNRLNRYAAVVLALVQSIGIVVSWKSAIEPTFGSTIVTSIFIVIILIAGANLVMWLGERITDYGVGNGISLIIFIGILSSFGTTLLGALKEVGNDINNLWFIIGFLAILVALFAFIVFIDFSERKIPVQYAKQIKGNKMYGGQTTFIPIKINSSGVMPIIFASSFLMFPQMIASFWPQSKFYLWYSKWMGVNSWAYMIFLSVLILFFAFFYSMIQFNTEEVSKNIQRYGGFIPGIRPGKPTGDYLGRINNRITFFGAIYLAIIALIPAIGFKLMGSRLANAFTATGMLIVVSVALEFDKQLEAQLMMKHHKGFLK